MAQQKSDGRKDQGPQVFVRGQQQFRHDLFKLEPEKMKKNISWSPKRVEIVELEHCHFFHTVDRRGKPMTKTNAVGGHWHEIKVTYPDGPTGVPHVVCGPPVKMGIKTLENGRKVKAVRNIAWQQVTENTDGTADVVDHEDNHVHQMTYAGSTVLVERGAEALPTADVMRALGLEKPVVNMPGVKVQEL